MSDYRGLIEEMEADKSKPEPEPDLAHERVVAVLYLLMRDEIPTGTLCKIITDMTEKSPDGYQFTNPHLEALARDYAGRIKEG
jgi:hypothetical protein